MWVILLHNADWDCFKTQISREILKIRNPLLEEHYAFWKSYISSKKLDVQETNCRFAQFNRIWNNLFGRWIEIRRAACSGIMGSNCFCLWKRFCNFRWNRATVNDVKKHQKSQGKINVMENIDSVPSNVQSSRQEALLYVFEDNEAVIKMIIKGRSLVMRHVSRTHRVALDWLFDRINLGTKIQNKYIDTKNQLADILTKGNFTHDEWNHLLCLFNISHFSPTVCSTAMAKRSQQDSGEERVTAKSRPMMNLIVRTPSFVSSSTSVALGKKHYGNQDPWKSVAGEDRSGRPGKETDLFEASDHYFHEQFMESFSSTDYSK